MMHINIQGIKDGKYPFEISEAVDSFEDISAEYVGDVTVKGVMIKHQNRFAFECEVSCRAKLICDISVKEYEDVIKFEFNSSYIADTILFFEQKDRQLGEKEEKAIHEDDKIIDLTNDIREELEVHLPMKRVAPEYRDKDFKEIYPEYSSDNKKKNKNTEVRDDRWAPLKNLKLN